MGRPVMVSDDVRPAGDLIYGELRTDVEYELPQPGRADQGERRSAAYRPIPRLRLEPD